jgi:hypothetical protein
LVLAFGIKSNNSALSLIGLLFYMATFATSSGNVTWCYMAEISTEKGMGIGATVSWILILVISFFTNNIVEAAKKISVNNTNYPLFLFFSGFTFFGAIFFFIFMKESLGKTALERE